MSIGWLSMPRIHKKCILVLVTVCIPLVWMMSLFSGIGIGNKKQMSHITEKLIQEEESESKRKKVAMKFLKTERNSQEGSSDDVESHAGAISSKDVNSSGILNHFTYLNGFSHDALKPAFKMESNRTAVSLVLGIPSVKREKKSYLIDTLTSLITNMNSEERNNCLIVVFIAETNISYVQSQSVELSKFFRNDIETGLLEIISPKPKYYPDFNKTVPSLGDSKERTMWRTKQSLDYCYLMMHAHTRGRYYIQLEDDLKTKPGYVTTMLQFAENQQNTSWFILEFSELGFIGKMFKTSYLPDMIHFFVMFRGYRPCDWLINLFIQTRVCYLDTDKRHCLSEKRIRYKLSLFQHIGTYSSLKGKIQNLKDSYYGKVQLRWPIIPPAEVETTLDVYIYFLYLCIFTIYSFVQLHSAVICQIGDFLKLKVQILIS